MNPLLYRQCRKYINTYDLLNTLSSIGELENKERLTLYRLCQMELDSIEADLEQIIVEADLKRSMINKQ